MQTNDKAKWNNKTETSGRGVGMKGNNEQGRNIFDTDRKTRTRRTNQEPQTIRRH